MCCFGGKVAQAGFRQSTANNCCMYYYSALTVKTVVFLETLVLLQCLLGMFGVCGNYYGPYTTQEIMLCAYTLEKDGQRLDH